MSRRWFSVVAPLAVLFAACGGGDDSPSAGGQSTPTSASGAPATTVTARGPIEGMQTFTVDAGHADGPLTYPQTPPVGGIHNPIWQACGVYAMPVQNEKAVHSLEHGAVWVAYRPDLPAADIATLATLAQGRDHVLISPYDGLPTPIVATAWGRQLRLESVTDSRLAEFIRLYLNQGPELNARC